MNGQNISLGITFFVIVAAIVGVFYFINNASSNILTKAISNPLMKRQYVEVSLTANNANQPSVEATKLPEFVFSLADRKFDSLINAASNQLTQLAKVSIVHTAYGADIKATVSIDKDKRLLLVQPQDIPNFKPGLYKLSLQLRTLEGVVNIDQDFTWGVIAVNTNKSIYQPGETAKIGLGVLDDKGNTMCMTGLFDHVDDLSMQVTDPAGNVTNFSSKDGTIKDSGQCGHNTVTNAADFQSTYTTGTPGIYQMKVVATVYGKTRQIQDYFKVDPSVQFDVERTSFPTRIYPESPYPVALRVTAKQNYQGTVEDIVPAFFGIEHVDGGQTVKDGDFTKIVWNVNLVAGQPQIFTYFIKFPMVSPEFYLIGPLKIGTFQEARQWQVASDAINSSTGVFTAEDNGSSNTWYRQWTGTGWNPLLSSPPTSMSNAPADSRWFSEKSSPITGEKLVALIDNNNGTTPLPIYMFHFDPSTALWSQDFKMTLPVTVTLADTRYMDIAYHQLSGNAMFVYNANENQNRYLTRTGGSGGSWGVSGTVASTVGTLFGTATAPKSWIRLLSQPHSDSILLTYVNTSNRVGAEIWDGHAWGNELIDDATNSPTAAAQHIGEVVSSAWEKTTQIPMIAWGNGSTGITYRRLVNGSWSAESTTGLTGFNTNPYWVMLAADDSTSTNRLALATSTSGATPNCYFAIWDGSSWTQAASGIGCRQQTANDDSQINNRPINVAWEHGTGRAVWVYNTAAAPTALNYRIWNGSFGADTAMGGTAQTNPISIEMYSDPYSVGIITMYTVGLQSATSVPVFDREWDGTSWTAVPANPLFGNIQQGFEHTEAWGFGFDLDLETQVAYRWFANSPGTDTSVDTALNTQDTSTTLTSANQKFRLRMLIYYPDSLAAGARSYTLQYIDPGTGTCAVPSGTGNPSDWADMPNVNDASTTLAYSDNAGVASASALTANAGLDPTYSGKTKINETYNEQNTFTTNNATAGDQVGLFDFSLVDKTTFGPTAHTFCFRVRRSTGVALQIGNYPQLTTAALKDVFIKGGSRIQGGTKIQ